MSRVLALALSVFLVCCSGLPRFESSRTSQETRLYYSLIKSVVRVSDVIEIHNSRDYGTTATGFYVTPNLILTNAHAVSNGKLVKINFSDNADKKFEVQVLVRDTKRDLALLKTTEVRRPLEFSKRPVVIGQKILVLGHPRGLTFSVNAGIVSHNYRVIDERKIAGIYLQVSQSIWPGNSGGPVVNYSGRVVGIINAGTPQGIGTAIPLRTVKAFLKQKVPELAKTLL